MTNGRSYLKGKYRTVPPPGDLEPQARNPKRLTKGYKTHECLTDISAQKIRQHYKMNLGK